MPSEGEHLEPLGGGISVTVSKEHRFGTDTVLLAWFSAPRPGDLAADLGTGCGTIPLLWTINAKPAHITAVELQENACELAARSIEQNGLTDSIDIIHADLRDLKGKVPGNFFDVVACNPPYKKSGTGVQNPGEERRIARHDDTCTLLDAALCAHRLLEFSGRFCLCLRPERLCDALEALRQAKLEPKRLRFVHQKADAAPNLFLLEGRKGAKPFLTVEPPLFLQNADGQPAEELKHIYGAYGEMKL